MVGVPRSKGCLTCRKRKVACDQTKPHCQNCAKRGTQCEGYARYPTILQYTSTGLKKRPRFEEHGTNQQDDGVTIAPTAPTVLSQFASISGRTAVNRHFLDQISASCVASYLASASSSTAVHELKSNWMWTTLDLPAKGQALEASIAALSLARIGLSTGDQSLLAKGRDNYAIGLSSLQYALQNPELQFQDRTLATIRTLSIYELWAMPWTAMDKAHVHERGMTQWCVAAGPRAITTEFALQVFHDVRWCIMNRAIDDRQRSPLGAEEWFTEPWRFFPKDSLQNLFDVGFMLAALLEDLGVCDSLHAPEASVSKRAQIALSCSLLRDTLEEWYFTHWSPVEHSPPPAQPADMPTQPASPGATHTEFASLWEATNIAYFWLFKMVLNDILAETASEDEKEDLIFESLELAVNIVSAAPYFIADTTGWLGPQRLFFPLRRAMTFLISKQSPFTEDARQAFQQVVVKLRTG